MTAGYSGIPKFSIRYLNITSLAGMIVFTLTTIIFYFGVLTISRSSFIAFDGDVGHTTGRIISKEKSSFAEGGQSIYRYPIYRITFEYRVGREILTNVGYTTSDGVRIDDKLDISYKESNPLISKAATLRASPFGVTVVLGIALPFSGLIIFLKGLRWGNNFLSLVQFGAIARGRLGKVTSNGEDHTAYYFYQDPKGTKRRIAFSAPKKRLEQEVKILFDENNPENAEIIRLDKLPILFGRNQVKQLLRGR